MYEIENKVLDKHYEFKESISYETFEFLINLFQLANINLNIDINEEYKSEITECLKKVKNFVLQNEKKEKKMFGFEDNVEKTWDIADIKLKSHIYFNRYCKIIDALLKEYEGVEPEAKKKIIDYYLFDNRLMELSTVGVSFYYDYKYEKGKATLFRSENGKCTWDNLCCKDATFVDTLKYVFNCCREHINKGNDKLILRSYSKCLGIDLFKYVSIPKGKENVKLCIKEKADTNIIRYNIGTFSLQEFIQKNGQVQGDIDFCIDISTPRDDKRENLKIWMDKFLGKDSTDIQSFTSPVSDKEVIMSYKPTNVVKYSSDVDCHYMKSDIEWEFELNRRELICLLYKYYSKYCEIKQESQCFKNTLKSYMDKNFKDSNNDEYKEVYQEFYDYIMKCIENIKDETRNKIEKILSFVQWRDEDINPEKSMVSIYKVESADNYINVFKQVLQDCM